MNDKTLLELAARAAEHELYWPHEDQEWNDWQTPYTEGKEWNPLTDDGDALRLAVKCDLSVQSGGNTCRFVVVSGSCGQILEERKPDEYAATRRAIVRAAAEIGKGME